jgi:hypothetical protein
MVFVASSRRKLLKNFRGFFIFWLQNVTIVLRIFLGGGHDPEQSCSLPSPYSHSGVTPPLFFEIFSAGCGE